MKTDIVGIMLKIAFGDESGVYADKYLEQLKHGEWTFWGTPRRCRHLEGGGRKLLLYDPKRKAVTAEAEILSVREVNVPHKYRWRNKFVPDTLHVYETPIELAKIRRIPGFEKVGVPGDRPPYRKLTGDQYIGLSGEREIGNGAKKLHDVDDLEFLSAKEGRKRLVSHLQRERDPKLVAAKKRSVLSTCGRLACEACGLEFAKKYGELGADYCEVHHRDGLSQRGVRKTGLSDLAIVCSNCHRMIHRTRNPMMSVEAFAERWLKFKCT